MTAMSIQARITLDLADLKKWMPVLKKATRKGRTAKDFPILKTVQIRKPGTPGSQLRETDAGVSCYVTDFDNHMEVLIGGDVEELSAPQVLIGGDVEELSAPLIIPFAVLEKALKPKANRKGRACLTVDGMELSIELPSGTTIKTDLFDPADAPDFALDNLGTDRSITMETSKIKAAIDRTIYAASDDKTRASLCGIYLESHEGRLSFVATDTHRLARVVTDQTVDIPDGNGCIAPKHWADVASRALAKLPKDSGAILKFGIGESTSRDGVGIWAEGFRLFSLAVEGRFPTYRNVYRDETSPHDYQLTIDANTLIEATNELSGYVSDKSVCVQLHLERDADHATFSVRDPELATAERQEPATVHFPETQRNGHPAFDPFAVGVQAKYLTEALEHLGSEEATFRFEDDWSPIMLESDGYLSVIMPMRI